MVLDMQVCVWTSDKIHEGSLADLLLAAEPWSRRRAAALACYAGVWPSWEGEE